MARELLRVGRRTRREPLYQWKDFIGDPADELQALQRMPPLGDAPVSVWETWHERMIVCWEQLAVRDSLLVEAAVNLTEQHRIKLKELREDPHGASRRGYWTPDDNLNI
jgi:hypothetical protein